MTSLMEMDGRSIDLIALLLFWAVVVVALVMSTTARELREESGHELSPRRPPAPSPRPGVVVPLHHPQTWPPGMHRRHLTQRRWVEGGSTSGRGGPSTSSGQGS